MDRVSKQGGTFKACSEYAVPARSSFIMVLSVCDNDPTKKSSMPELEAQIVTRATSTGLKHVQRPSQLCDSEGTVSI